ncbi:hypothetical protein CF335_g5587 [Tilletia laevis]|nr:hypothetical protein CF335_g5587 [Tilletia laevis]
MSSAFKVLLKIYDKLVLETVKEAKDWIRTEKEAWQAGWEMVRESEYADRKSSWEYLALYVEKLRQEYYNSRYGDRPDPSVWLLAGSNLATHQGCDGHAPRTTRPSGCNPRCPQTKQDGVVFLQQALSVKHPRQEATAGRCMLPVWQPGQAQP